MCCLCYLYPPGEVAARCPILASHTLLTVAGQVGIDNVSARDSLHLSAPDALNTMDTAFLLISPSNIQKPQIVFQLLDQPHSTILVNFIRKQYI